MVKTLLLIASLGSLLVVSANESTIDVLTSISKSDNSDSKSDEIRTTSRLDQKTHSVSSEESTKHSVEKETEKNVDKDKSTINPTEKSSHKTTEIEKTGTEIEKITIEIISTKTDQTMKKSPENTTDKPTQKVTQPHTGQTQQNYSQKTTENPTRSSTDKTTDSWKESKENSTEKTTEKNANKTTIKPTEKYTEKTTKKSTDGHTEKVTDRITEKSTKAKTDKPDWKVTETSTDQIQQNNSHKTTENPTKSSTGKPHSTEYGSHSEEKSEEDGNTSGSGHSEEKSEEDGNTSGSDETTDNSWEESNENSTEETTEDNTKKTTIKPTEKTTKKSTDSTEKVTDRTTGKSTKTTTEKSDGKVTEASTDKTQQNHLDKTTKSYTLKPHWAHRKRCADNEIYEQWPSKVREPQTCEHLGVECEDCDEEDEEDDGSDKGACICVKGYVRNERGVCMPAEKCPSCGGDKNATIGCGINCGRRCSDYDKEVQCIQVCYVNGCDCRENFVLDELTGKCVLPEDCSRKNPSNSKKSCSKCDACNKKAQNDKHKSCKIETNDGESTTESQSGGDDNGGKCNKNSMSTTTEKPQPPASSKCYEEALTLFTKGTTVFSTNLLKELMLLKPGENVMGTTPVVLYLLAQLGVSANGDAYAQIMAALNFNNVELIKCFFKRMVSIVLNIKNVEYRFITKIYSDSVCPLTSNFREQTKNIFAFEPENLDLENPKSASIISQEVAVQTNNRIVDFIKPGFLSTLSGLVLISAEYFQGQWQKQFDPLDTMERDFRISASKTIKVRTMYMKGTFMYTENSRLNAKILKLKYIGDEFSFVIILPNRVDGIKDVVEKIRNLDLLTSALDSLKMESVEIFLPSFNMTVANVLRVPVERVNVTKIFHNETAGLEDITSCNGTYVSNILQKATLQVDEFGMGNSKITDFETEESTPKENNRRSFIFKADHPFIYNVYYNNIIVYFGAYLH